MREPWLPAKSEFDVELQKADKHLVKMTENCSQTKALQIHEWALVSKLLCNEQH